MVLYLGGSISPAVLLDWTPIGDYIDFLSVDKKYFYITFKDSKRQDTQWGRISTFKYNFKGELIEAGVFNNPESVTTNQDDWRKTIAHSYLANPSNNSDVCVSQYAFYGYINIYKNKMYTFDPDQMVTNNEKFQKRILNTNTSAKIGISILKRDKTICLVSKPKYIKNIKIKKLNQTEVAFLSAAAIQLD